MKGFRLFLRFYKGVCFTDKGVFLGGKNFAFGGSSKGKIRIVRFNSRRPRTVSAPLLPTLGEVGEIWSEWGFGGTSRIKAEHLKLTNSTLPHSRRGALKASREALRFQSSETFFRKAKEKSVTGFPNPIKKTLTIFSPGPPVRRKSVESPRTVAMVSAALVTLAGQSHPLKARSFLLL